MALFKVIVFYELPSPSLHLVRINSETAIQSFWSMWPCLTHPICIQAVGTKSCRKVKPKQLVLQIAKWPTYNKIKLLKDMFLTISNHVVY